RLIRVSLLPLMQEGLNHVGQPFGLPDYLLEPSLRGGRQSRLRQSRRRQSEHTRDWLPHVMTRFTQLQYDIWSL
ncbi:MAG TPA: hypothetical protein VFO44_11705, partial [Steroidobacteraceae bacterium]|nr:hypothetical protein [Steroidobacteraceae bacterium]